MAHANNKPGAPVLLGHRARWAAAPYCEFKDDKARLLALVSRDIRMVLVAFVVVLTGTSLPWQKWVSFLA